jgi:hypothetical protein
MTYEIQLGAPVVLADARLATPPSSLAHRRHYSDRRFGD